MPGRLAEPASVVGVTRRETWRRALRRWLTISVGVVALSGCAAELKRVPADWENPGHRLVGERLSPLLQAAGREPETCEVFFLETEHLDAASLGNCTFAFTTGLAETRDATLITGVAAHEVAHEALRHSEKGEAVVTTIRIAQEAARASSGWGALVALAIIPFAMVALPAYARAHEAAADTKAVEILRAAHDPDPAGTMIYTLETLSARERLTGGGLLGSHPDTTRRLGALRALQEPRLEPPAQEQAAPPLAVALPKTSHTAQAIEIRRRPPDPRADWSERYKKMVAGAEMQANEAETRGAVGGDVQLPQ